MPVATSQRRTVLSEDPEARVLPSGLKATLHTRSVCPSKARRERAGGDVPEAHRLVSGPGGEGLAVGAEGDAPTPNSYVPRRRGGSVPVATSQRRTVLSSDPEARVLPSGLKATLRHRIRMSLEGAEGGAGGDVPEAHGLVIGPGGEGLPSGLKATLRTGPE